MVLSQAINIVAFYNAVKDQKLPLKTSFKLVRLNSALQSSLEFYQKSLHDIAQEFGVKDENGELVVNENGGWNIQTDKIEACNDRLIELQNLPVTDLPDITFSVDDFANVEIEPSMLMDIEEFIVD